MQSNCLMHGEFQTGHFGMIKNLMLSSYLTNQLIWKQINKAPNIVS